MMPQESTSLVVALKDGRKNNESPLFKIWGKNDMSVAELNCPPGHDKVRDLGIRDRRHGLPFVGREGRWGEKR